MFLFWFCFQNKFPVVLPLWPNSAFLLTVITGRLVTRVDKSKLTFKVHALHLNKLRDGPSHVGLELPMCFVSINKSPRLLVGFA